MKKWLTILKMDRWFKRNVFKVSMQVANNHMKKRLNIISYWGNENLNHKKLKNLIYLLEWLKLKRLEFKCILLNERS